jgi:hypothetical protein
MNFFVFLSMGIAIVSSSKKLPEQEVHTFLSDNGFRYITVVENSSALSKTGHKIVLELGKSGTLFVRIDISSSTILFIYINMLKISIPLELSSYQSNDFDI